MKTKKTEVGLLPEDWEVKPLEYYFDYISYGFTNPMPTTNAGVYMITARDVNFGQILYDSARLTPLWAYNEYLTKKSKPIKNDILLTKDGTLGRLALVGNEKICINQSIAVIRPNSKIEPLFLKKLLESNYYQRVMLENAGGSTIKHIYVSIVNKMLIGVPPTLEEQKAIATALSDIDALINNLDQLIIKKKAIKKGAMQQLLTPPHKGGKQLAGFTEEWMEKKLGDVGEITGAGIDKKIIEGEKSVRLFNYMDVMKRDYVYNHELDHEVTAPNSKIITCNVIEGDIFLTPSSELRTDIGVSAIAIEDMQGVVYSYHIYRLRYNIEINKYYGLYLLKTKQFLDQAEKMCEGSGKRYVVSMGKFRNMIVHLPKDVKEQEAIANILYDMDKEIEQLDRKKAKYQDIKQGMMQELLTGKTRLI